MDAVSSNVLPSPSGRCEPDNSTPPIAPSSLYSSSPTVLSACVGNGSTHFQSQISQYNPPLNSVLESHARFPSNFSCTYPDTLVPPVSDRTRPSSALKSNVRTVFKPSESNEESRIAYAQSSPGAAPLGGDIKGGLESTHFKHNYSPYQQNHFGPAPQTMCSITLPTMAPINPKPHTTEDTYFAPRVAHLDGFLPQQPHSQEFSMGLFGRSGGHTYGYKFMERECGLTDSYEHSTALDNVATPGSVKRHKPSRKQPWQPSDDDEYLIKLKDEDQLPWKEIILRFEKERRGSHRVPALQMRLKRIKDRLARLSSGDSNKHRLLRQYRQHQSTSL
ncbi:hypothetical protein TWF481_002964 [Arthrobotrys musiformis]|uniref:Uncharacterized protein n=1 Tax=Arthrobotrys musiformis TaxID=47236 RepID=A0AAV9VTT9_9PEZI